MTTTQLPAAMTGDPAAWLTTPDGIADPFPVYRALTRENPIYWSPAHEAWIVTGHNLVQEVYKSHHLFSSIGNGLTRLARLPAQVRSGIPTVELVEGMEMLSRADPPRHTQHRLMIGRPLAPRRVGSRAEWVTELCDRMAGELAGLPEPDLIRDYSLPIAYNAVLDLFGAPMEDLDVYREATSAWHQFVAVTSDPVAAAERYEAALRNLRTSVESALPGIAERGDDGIIGSLIEAHARGELTRDELFVMIEIFLTAAQDNMIYTVAATVYELLRHPGQLADVRADPSLAAAAYEEGVRFDTPGQKSPRRVVGDCEFHGHQMEAGQFLYNFKAAAVRDGTVWSHPDEFDIHRDQNEAPGGTLAFGKGIHYCIGVGVARLVGPIAVSALLRRFPRIGLVRGWEAGWGNVPTFRKLTDLPLRLG